MPDTFISFLPDLIPLAVAFVGIIMSYKQPEKPNQLRTTLVLIAAGFAGSGVIVWARHWTESKQAIAEAAKFQSLESHLHSDMQTQLQTQLSKQKEELIKALASQTRTPQEQKFITRASGYSGPFPNLSLKTRGLDLAQTLNMLVWEERARGTPDKNIVERYKAEYLSQVEKIRKELAAQGLVNERLDVLYQDPHNATGIQVIAQAIGGQPGGLAWRAH